MARVRLAVVLLLEEPQQTEINGLRRALGDTSLARVQPHVTLVSPINVRIEDVDAATALLRRAARSVDPFSLHLGPVSTFAPETPVITLGVAGDLGPVDRLRHAVFQPPFDRAHTLPFVPHVTLLDNASAEQISAALVALRHFSCTVRVSSVHLMQQQPREGVGHVWIPVADALFEAPVVVGAGGLSTELTTSTLLDPAVLAQFVQEPAITDLVVVARRDDYAVGFVTAQSFGDDLRITQLRVIESQRGEGVGTHLVNQLAFVAAKRGYAALSSALATDVVTFLEGRGFHGGVRQLMEKP